MLTTNQPQPRLVLIDDDETYNAIMLRVAEQAGVQLDVFTSLLDLGCVSMLGRYDAAIVDYNLGQMTGIEVASTMSALLPAMPMILISQSLAPGEPSTWPESVRSFIPKAAGYHHVVSQAARVARAACARNAGLAGRRRRHQDLT